MSFGRRLALFVLLIVLVPTLGLLGMLFIVSEDSRSGKADARLSAGLETALALYSDDISAAEEHARAMAGDPDLAAALASGNEAQLEEFARSTASGEVQAVEVLDESGAVVASAGSPEAVAFSEVGLADRGESLGTLRVSVTTADELATEVGRLTGRDLVLSREGEPLAATVEAPETSIETGETEDLDVGGEEFRAHLLALDEEGDETLLLLGPGKEGGFFSIDRPAALLLLGFLLLAMLFAYVLARALTGLHDQVAEQAVTDSLTGLWNRRRMQYLLYREVERANRFGHELAFVIVDVDDFKLINDTYGHLQGDKVLEAVAELVRGATRSIDVGARYGGDELALVLLETDAKGAEILAERLRERIKGTKIPLRGGGSMGVTVSVGVAAVPNSATEGEALIDAADQALLDAKRTGKDQTKIAPPSNGTPDPGRGGDGRAGARSRRNSRNT